MTNSSKSKELLSKLFYGNAKKSAAAISKTNNKLVSPIKRQKLQQKREVLKSVLKNFPSAVSPQALHISLPGTPKTRRCLPVQESPKQQQAIIDAGQKKIGASQCNLCGMVYTVNLPHDQEQHASYHKRFLDNLKFNGWKNERVLASFTKGRILKILPSDPKYTLKKVNDICCVIDADLGFENHVRFNNSISKVIYLYVSDKHQVAGCLIAEPISHAFRLLTNVSESGQVSTCARFSEPAVCGVSRIWTYYPYRRQGIATRLVDALRNTFVLGACLNSNQIAFSDPTADGIQFAAYYCKTESFLTYNGWH